MKKLLLVCLVITFTAAGYSEGLFESLFSSDEENTGYELNGHVRASMFSYKDGDEFKYAQSEFALKLRVDKGKYGNAFAEVRYISNFYRNYDFDNDIQNNFEIREAYINLYAGYFDLKIGNQIIVWGRADGYNPTDLINPKVNLLMPLNEDDRHSPNFMVRGTFNTGNIRLESIFIPMLKTGPQAYFRNGYYFDDNAKAFKLSYEVPVFDGSVSYYYGPNANYKVISGVSRYGYGLLRHKIRSYGVDFSTTTDAIGIRGEVSYKEVSRERSGPKLSPELEYVLGVDKAFNVYGNIIIQYFGKYVEQPYDGDESIYD